MCTLTDLFVGIEGYTDVAMLDFGVLLQVVDSGDDFGYAGFVVSAEQSGAVGHDEVLSLIVEQFGELGGGEDDVFSLVERDVFTVVALDNACSPGEGCDVAEGILTPESG